MKDGPMRIAQVSPLYESVPPKAYGGTERIVSYLTEELVDQGHEVTLFASGDSKTRACLVAPCPHSLRSDPSSADTLVHTLVMLEQVFQESGRFDLIHFHIDWLHYPLCRRQRCPAGVEWVADSNDAIAGEGPTRYPVACAPQ